MIPTERDVTIMAAIRQEREREAIQERLIKQCSQSRRSPGWLVRKLGSSTGRILEIAGKRLQEQFGDTRLADSGKLSARSANYG